MATGPKAGWGGKRDNQTGRPRIGFSDRQVKELLKAAKKKEKETGKSIADQLMAIIYGPASKVKVKERIAGIKVFYDQTVTSATESDSTVKKVNSPAIYLPAQKPDPANVVPIKKAGNG